MLLGVKSLMRATTIRRSACAVGTVYVAAVLAIVVVASVRQSPTSSSKRAFNGKLPVLDGKNLSATLVEVTYPPGGVNPSHRHPCPVIGYVLEGAVRMQLQGQEERVIKAGESFYESPADVHAVSANASQDRPARFLAYFVCDRETPLSVPVKEDRGEE